MTRPRQLQSSGRAGKHVSKVIGVEENETVWIDAAGRADGTNHGAAALSKASGRAYCVVSLLVGEHPADVWIAVSLRNPLQTVHTQLQNGVCDVAHRSVTQCLQELPRMVAVS